MKTRRETQDAYNEGRASRTLKESILSCPFGTAEFELRHWWLAGWNDLDMELG